MAKKKGKSAGKLAAQRKRTAGHKLKKIRRALQATKSERHKAALRQQIERREKERL